MASGSFTRAAADTQRQSCNGDTHQIWAPITNPSTGLFGWFISGPWYIDLAGNRLADGTKFQVWEQTGNPPYPDNAEQECGSENASGQPVESGLCVP